MSMKAEIRHIATYIKQHAGSEHTTVELIDKYFADNVVWSLEKEEWSKMDQQQRDAFVQEITSQKNGNGKGEKSTPAKRVAAIVKVAKKQTKVPAKTTSKKKVPLKLTKSTGKNGKPTKMSQAKALYAKMVKEKKDRQQILAAFMKECKSTKHCANTYYQLIKSKS